MPHHSKALFLIADGSEDVETIATLDILRRANIEVSLCSTTSKSSTDPVTFALKTRVIPDTTLNVILDEHGGTVDGVANAFDIVILPGGSAGARHMAQKTVFDLLAAFKSNGKWVAAICASPAIVLHASGHFPGLRGTCYPSLRDQLTGWSVVDESVVIDGKVITSQGPGTAYDFALAIAEVLVGKHKSGEVRNGMLL